MHMNDRFFWLPMYLIQYFDAVESNLVSIVYDIGMIPGEGYHSSILLY